ncbi:DUF2835 domain-containing protein [Marinicellulosiphila megalodicopiae]|uniref:DUF2835 domain-containing protein n=1 Tax=Marinicellulosiphila megalodicopiae TaxID=2724896 RepID=UPI003BAEE65B
MNNQLTFNINIPYEDFEAVYRGAAKSVLANSEQGKSVRFPADILRPFLTRDGIVGRFCVQFDANHKFSGIKRM